MEKVLMIIDKMESILGQQLNQLEELEREKEWLLKQSKKIDAKTFELLEKRLIESDRKYMKLLENVKSLSKEIKMLKSKL